MPLLGRSHSKLCSCNGKKTKWSERLSAANSGKLTSSVVNWRQKSHIVWEQHYGSAPPEGYTIAFLNRDTKDCRIENLYAVSPRVMREMSKKKWWSTDRELTLAAIRWCELFYAMKEAEGVRKNIQNGEKNGKS